MTFYLLLSLLRHLATIQFNINYINFSSASTRSGANNKLILPHHLNNTSRYSCLHQLPSLWNTMLIIDLDMTFNKLKSKLKQYLWKHFLNHFDVNHNCTLHYYQCPCNYSRCHHSKPSTINVTHLKLMFACKHESIVNLLFICNSRLLAQVTSSP